MKICRTCRVEKETQCYSKDKTQRDGLESQCKSCVSVRHRSPNSKCKEKEARRLDKTEQWEPVQGYAGLYSVSANGLVRSEERTIARRNGRIQTIRSRILTPSKDTKGYLQVGLYHKDKTKKMHFVHKLVYTSFKENPVLPGYQIDHMDGNQTNNKLGNLQALNSKHHHWATVRRMKRNARRQGYKAGWEACRKAVETVGLEGLDELEQ